MGVSNSRGLFQAIVLRVAETSTRCPSCMEYTWARLRELIGALKKIRITDGSVLMVEPSTGSEPITNEWANATGAGSMAVVLKYARMLNKQASITIATLLCRICCYVLLYCCFMNLMGLRKGETSVRLPM